MQKAIVVISIYKPKLTAYEEISLRQCCRVLGGHPIAMVAPPQLDIVAYGKILAEERTNFQVVHFPAKYFKNIQAYNRLMTHPCFYERFLGYEYILIYQLDAFVFRDDLFFWCDKGYSYIGAPWMTNMFFINEKTPYFGVGNGGFSLRRTKDHLGVIRKFGSVFRPSDFKWYSTWGKNKPYQLLKFTYHLLIGNNTHYLLNRFPWNEDVFYGLFVGRDKRNHFNVAPVEEALRFSFEARPRKMFADNGNQLPFGCHAWWRYDLGFWKEHIGKEGYGVSTNMPK